MFTSMYGTDPPIFDLNQRAWLLGLTIIPWLVRAVLAKFLPPREATLVAYNLAATTPNLYMTVVGVQAWFFDDHLASVWYAKDGHARVYEPIEQTQTLVGVIIAFEFWNTLCVLVLPEYRTASFVFHHALTMYLACLGTFPFLHSYILFFMGVASSSSALLGVVDIFRHVEALHTNLPTINLVARLSFAITFIAFRSIMWPIIMYSFWIDVVGELRAGTAHSVWACSVYMFASCSLTGLQLIWTKQIIKGIYKAVAGGGEKSA